MASLPVIGGHELAAIDAMPAMLATILGPGIKGIVVAGMLAATMSVNSSYLLGWSAVISQDVILPVRQLLRRPPLSSQRQILINRIANLFVGFFLMFWGLYYTPPGAVYLYLNITGTIFLAGAFVGVVGGLYWKRANTTGGYMAMLMGAAGAIVPFFFLHWSENVTGFVAFGLAAASGGWLFVESCQQVTIFGKDETSGRGNESRLWFWTVSLLVAGPAFAYIPVVVAFRLLDLLELFRRWRRNRPKVGYST
jgi:Na+/proline symporter